MIADLLVILCLTTASDVLHVPTWQVARLAPIIAQSCERAPYETMVQLRGGVPVWPR